MNQTFEALSRICLNNWHYIRHRTLSFSEGINFFTGHSGSGKSTVIDAIQIVLYANTDGRGFFNKAAADDSDRSLIEYLRGMINIGEDNSFSYLRNRNFSSTIVLELQRTDTGERQCVGVVFDVETASNEISRLFFWHKGGIPDHEYRTEDGGDRAMSTAEVKNWLTRTFAGDDCYFGSHNERFRRQLYDIYLGGLDAEKFPMLFKKAIPFRMNIKLEDFVKEYICTEKDIHIEDMQLSVMEYGRMCRKIEDTCREIGSLKAICGQYDLMDQARKESRRCNYYSHRFDVLSERLSIAESMEKIRVYEENREKGLAQIENLNREIGEMTEKCDELLRRIAGSGYDRLVEQQKSVNTLIERMASGKGSWQQTAERLKKWEDLDTVSNRTLWDIDAFMKGEITEEGLIRLKADLAQIRDEALRQQQEARSELRQMEKRQIQIREELDKLKSGSKAYPRELESARTILQNRLYRKTGVSVPVQILADLIDIRDDSWRSAVEGYLGNNKLALVVEPRYARAAIELYQELDKEKYYQVTVLDTERVLSEGHSVVKGALSEEVETGLDYVRAYMDFLLGKVIKCETVDDLRECRIGITRDCVMYHSYRIQHINPASYTVRAYIGKKSLKQRTKLLEKELEQILEKKKPHQEIIDEASRILGLEDLSQDLPVYLGWKKDMEELHGQEKEQKKLRRELEILKSQNVDQWEQEREALLQLVEQRKAVLRQQERAADQALRDAEEEKKSLVGRSEILLEKERALRDEEQRLEPGETKEGFDRIVKEQQSGLRYDRLRDQYHEKKEKAEECRRREMERLVNLRSEYLRNYQNRNFSPTAEDNAEYQGLLDSLNFDRLEEYRARAAEQAQTAVEHFKDDFVYKIRSAIKDALQRRDELNRIISRLDFGKDKYQFYIGKNKGPDGVYYDMFMDESLEIDPADLGSGWDNQLNLFTMEHENHYGMLVNDLIRIFIPPENATAQEQEEARKNMEKYADYRTYLSFDMQQIVQDEDETIRIRLSQMIRKNSGGEGQNPLYVALLASFAQVYKIDAKPGLIRNPAIRLVVLDEAFSKMDAEKVASCIQLIRGLGFQAVISATNDKIQNYLETVDKIFVFANPNKKAISIQEFERKDFRQLKRGIGQE